MTVSDDLAFMPATELVAAYRAKSVSPVEATQAALDRIEAHNERLNAFFLVDAEGALSAAAESKARWQRGEPIGLIDGVPTSIKDILLTKDWPTLRGSKTIDAEQDWTSTRRRRRGCASTAPCCSARRRLANSAGRA